MAVRYATLYFLYGDAVFVMLITDAFDIIVHGRGRGAGAGG